MKSLLEFITDRENIPKREDMPKEDMPKIDKDTPKEDITKEDMPKEDITKEDIHKEDIPKMDKDTPKEDNIINNENEVNENKVYNFKSGVSSIGFRKIKIYRF